MEGAHSHRTFSYISYFLSFSSKILRTSFVLLSLVPGHLKYVDGTAVESGKPLAKAGMVDMVRKVCVGLYNASPSEVEGDRMGGTKRRPGRAALRPALELARIIKEAGVI